MIDEPVLAAESIQGHVMPGFGGRAVRLLGWRFAETADLRGRLRELLCEVTAMAAAQKRRHRRREALIAGRPRPVESGVEMAWSFSYSGLRKIGADLSGVREQRFITGMAQDAAELNDPVDADGVPLNWVVGDTSERVPDLLVILEADEPKALTGKCDRLAEHFGNTASVIYDDQGSRRPDEKEHFGFRDGVSQPAPRGRLPDGQSFMRRVIAADDPRHEYYAKPGQPLVWPGQFVFGYAQQTEDPGVAGPTRSGGPEWMQNGSYLVLRRLNQDVKLFRDRFTDLATRLSQEVGRPVDADWLMAQAVGRWPDGTPVVVSADVPDPELADDRMRVNHFKFSGPSRPIEVEESDGTMRSLPGVLGDPLARRCPHLAHIRKVNPRDDSTDIGSNKTMMKLILRRGANFGPTYEDEPEYERGLLFLSYQTSLEHQFVFLQKNWANALSRPGGIGRDLIIGRTTQADNRRTGHIQIDGRTVHVDIHGDWVQCTGGGYFFTPSLAALGQLLS